MRAMKDSGIPWIGEIPDNWCVVKCKTILAANDSGVWGNDPLGDDLDKVVIRSTEQTIDGGWCIETPAKRDLRDIDYRGSRICKGDLLITKSSGSDLHIGKTTIADDYFIENECYFSNFIQRIRCNEKYRPRLLWYLFNSIIIREQCVYLQNSTSGIGNINASIINNLYLPIPPIEEQTSIIRFLDAECARIDAVMEQTRASIEEYKKLKQSIITEAVTKGIRPNRPMKESGIDWIGQIPAEWDCTTVNRIATVVRGASPRPAGDPRYFNGNDVPWITVAEVTNGDGKFIFTTETYLTAEGANYSRIVEEGTLLLSNSGATLGVPKITKIRGCINDGSLAFYNLQINQDYLLYVFSGRTMELRKQMQGYGQPNLNTTIVKGLWLPLPTNEEQVEIVNFLDTRITEIESLITKKEQFLSEMESYKKSLIFEYVTGKKEVV